MCSDSLQLLLSLSLIFLCLSYYCCHYCYVFCNSNLVITNIIYVRTSLSVFLIYYDINIFAVCFCIINIIAINRMYIINICVIVIIAIIIVIELMCSSFIDGNILETNMLMITLWITVRCCWIRKNKYINSNVVDNVKRCSKHDNFSLLTLSLSKGHDNENHIDGNLPNTSPYYH